VGRAGVGSRMGLGSTWCGQSVAGGTGLGRRGLSVVGRRALVRGSVTCRNGRGRTGADWFGASGAGGTGVAGVVGYGVKRLGMGSQTRKALIRGLPGLAMWPRIPR
jgi:hypothetical protein